MHNNLAPPLLYVLKWGNLKKLVFIFMLLFTMVHMMPLVQYLSQEGFAVLIADDDQSGKFKDSTEEKKVKIEEGHLPGDAWGNAIYPGLIIPNKEDLYKFLVTETLSPPPDQA